MCGEDSRLRRMCPIVCDQSVFGHIVVVKILMRLWRVSHNHCAKNTIASLQPQVRMPEVSPCVLSIEVVTKILTRRNRALRNVWNTVHERRALLVNAMPMNCGSLAHQSVFHVNDDCVVETNLDARPWKWSVHHSDASLHAIRWYAVRPKAIRLVGRTIITRFAHRVKLFNNKFVVARELLTFDTLSKTRMRSIDVTVC